MQKADGHVLFMPHFPIIYSCSCSLQNDSPVILASLIKRREVQWLRGGNHSAELSTVAARLAGMDAALWRGAEQLSGVLLESALGREETTVSPGSQKSSLRSCFMLNCWPAQQMRLLEGCRNPCGKAEAQHFANLTEAVGRQPWQARDVTVCGREGTAAPDICNSLVGCDGESGSARCHPDTWYPRASLHFNPLLAAAPHQLLVPPAPLLLGVPSPAV